MKTNRIQFYAAAVTALGLALATAPAADNLKRADKEFITDTYEDGLAEVEAGRMAQRKTGNADVKSLAEMIVTDHSKANTELKALADSKKIEVAQEPTTVAKGKAAMLDRKTGADFDKEWVDAMVNNHRKSIEAFEKRTAEGEDADIKNFASKTLPTLKTHLSHAEEVQKKIGKP